MEIKDLKPAVFTEHPWDSSFQNAELEIVARNIMVVLKKTGNIFRKLSWEEYKEVRLADGDFSWDEHTYFRQVKNFCLSAREAMAFSKTWKQAAEKELKKVFKKEG